MTTDLVRVFSVSDSETVQPGVRQFIITTTLAARPDICLQLQTVNPYVASMCRRAKEINRPIAVVHERTKFGDTVRKAHFVKTEAA